MSFRDTNFSVHFRSQKEYDVNEAKDAEKGGRDNKAYSGEEARKAAAVNGSSGGSSSGSGDQKWVSNYVPYGDYPKGNVVYVKEVRRVALKSP